jgi:hypothetical protein
MAPQWPLFAFCEIDYQKKLVFWTSKSKKREEMSIQKEKLASSSIFKVICSLSTIS